MTLYFSIKEKTKSAKVGYDGYYKREVVLLILNLNGELPYRRRRRGNRDTRRRLLLPRLIVGLHGGEEEHLFDVVLAWLRG